MHPAFHRWTPVFAVLGWLATGAAQAHFPWVVAEHNGSVPDAPMTARVQFGHGPGEDARSLAAARVEQLRLIEGDGGKQALQPADDDHWHAPEPVARAASALLTGTQVPGYWSRTPEGGKRQSRQTLDNVSHCSYSQNGFKALLGGMTGIADAVTASMGHPLEIVPTGVRGEDPRTLLVRMMLRGVPTAVALTVTAIGDEAVSEVPVGADGEAAASLTGEGPWLLHAQYSEAYGDAAVCDERSFNATLFIGAP